MVVLLPYSHLGVNLHITEIFIILVIQITEWSIILSIAIILKSGWRQFVIDR